MRLVFLGTAGYHPNEWRHTSCLMLPEPGFVLDAGTGFFRVRDRLQTPHLHVFLTHAHLDHVAGLTYLLDVLHQKPVESVIVYGREDHLRSVTKGLFASPLFPVSFQYSTCPVGLELVVDSTRVKTLDLDHPGGSIAYRFEWPDCTLAYVTDTRCTSAYADFVRGVDLLVHECNFPDGNDELAARTGHSQVGEVLRLARLAQVKRLVLTHLNPLLDPDDPAGLRATQEHFPGVVVAADGLEIDF